MAGYGMAQPATDMGQGAGPAAHAQGMGMGMGKHDPAQMQTRMTQRLAKLKNKLNITPAQEAAWTSYADALKPMPRAAMSSSRAELNKLTMPERLDRMRALHTEHMTAKTAQMAQYADATKAFYATLSADQKKVFDDQFSHYAGGKGGHRSGHMSGQHERDRHAC